jgi:hypothetical protein
LQITLKLTFKVNSHYYIILPKGFKMV